MNELELLGHVLATSAELKLLAHHQLTYCSNCRRPLSTHMAGDRGFPDLLIAGPGGVLYRENKTAFGLLRPSQKRWRYQLQASGADWATWQPIDWLSGRIEDELQAITSPVRLYTEHALLMSGGGYHLRNPDPEIERIYPLASWITDNQRNGHQVYRRRITVIDDWSEVA